MEAALPIQKRIENWMNKKVGDFRYVNKNKKICFIAFSRGGQIAVKTVSEFVRGDQKTDIFKVITINSPLGGTKFVGKWDIGKNKKGGEDLWQNWYNNLSKVERAKINIFRSCFGKNLEKELLLEMAYKSDFPNNNNLVGAVQLLENAKEATEKGVKFTCYSTIGDQLVTSNSALLNFPGVENFVIRNQGHVSALKLAGKHLVGNLKEEA
jgi:hypothetical protein